MANKSISELTEASTVNNQDLFVLEQGGLAKKMTAETFITTQSLIDALASALDGHGGIQSVTLASVSGRIRTYRITFADGSATTFQVYDGTSIERITKTSSAGRVDTYTIYMTDGTTSFFTVTNGADGDVSADTLNNALAKKAPVIPETTASSAIVSFADGADDMPMQNVLVDIDPVQDDTYGDPYPAGGGKNKLPNNATDGSTTQNGVTVTATNGVYSFSGTASAAVTIIIPLSASVDLSPSTNKIAFLNNKTVSNASIGFHRSGAGQIHFWGMSPINRVASGWSDTGNEVVDGIQISVNSGTDTSGLVVSPMLMSLSESDPSTFAPYSNICPITGHTEVNVTRTGKNLLDVSNAVNATTIVDSVDADGMIHFKDVSARWGNTYIGKMFVKTGQTYVLSATLAYGRIGLSTTNGYPQLNVNIPDISVHGQGSASALVTKYRPSISFTANFTGIVYAHYCSDTDQASHSAFTGYVWCELGSTATTYEPYIAPTTVSLSWQTEADTVYGGTIDVATGVLTVNMAIVDMGALTWNYSSVSDHERFYVQIPAKGAPSSETANAVCSIFRVTTNNNTYAHVFDNSLSIGSTGYVYVYASAYSDAATFKAAVTGQTLCYELAAPQTYQLTAQQLATLYGNNNVWSDLGDVTVTYPADTKMYIEKLTIPSEDDLVANQAITSGEYFMIGNSLYLALANIASGAQITIGTNAQRVSLADALNNINS